jgi:hypothetical protein
MCAQSPVEVEMTIKIPVYIIAAVTAAPAAYGIYISYVTNQARENYGLNNREANAFAHAYASADLTMRFGASFAKLAGDFKEIYVPGNNAPGTNIGNWDTFKDLYNNETGRQIGNYFLKTGNSSRSDLEISIIQTLRNGDLVVNSNDPRIPRGLNEEANFSGDPRDFNQMLAFWRGPNATWQDVPGQSFRTLERPRCFPADTPILMADGTTKPIDAIDLDDWIMALDPAQPFAGLVPRQVTRLYRNKTDTWLKLTFLDGGTLSATPGHEMLAADGRFARLGQLVSWQADGTGRVTLVGESGELRPARAETIRFSAATAHLYPLADAAALAQGHQIAPPYLRQPRAPAGAAPRGKDWHRSER